MGTFRISHTALVPVSELFIPRVGSQMKFVGTDFTFPKLSHSINIKEEDSDHISPHVVIFPLHRRTASFVNIMRLWLCHCGPKKFCKTAEFRNSLQNFDLLVYVDINTFI